jgi:hypothetical protein
MSLPRTWRKSSKSQNGGSCVEVRGDLGAVRDSKNPDGPALEIGTKAVTALMRSLR